MNTINPTTSNDRLLILGSELEDGAAAPWYLPLVLLAPVAALLASASWLPDLGLAPSTDGFFGEQAKVINWALYPGFALLAYLVVLAAGLAAGAELRRQGRARRAWASISPSEQDQVRSLRNETQAG
ncbi:hypothetical protein [Pimelobacter sp. 30-1]|uniref:hypothetical protein n=1 Tax=Pimelobacter sp. 30-1 TaxID=2004991 RepID=UPI001C058A6E|nr:hypothetical protein [Pimelobacter sp. 30-1]MBU2698799.1 hypothetical protein [Pimelobacter sp. 30-1]